jgi:hypothetical protein
MSKAHSMGLRHAKSSRAFGIFQLIANHQTRYGTAMNGFRTIFAKHPKLVSALLVATLLTAFFAFRFIYGIVYWSQHREEPIRPWMTIGYVGKSWDVSPRAIDDIAGLPKPVEGRPYTLQEIADQRGVPVDDIIHQVEAAITKLRTEKRD